MNRPTSLRLDTRLLEAVNKTAAHTGVKPAVLLRQCVRLGLAEVLKSEALIASVTRRDYNSTPIGEGFVVPLALRGADDA